MSIILAPSGSVFVETGNLTVFTTSKTELTRDEEEQCHLVSDLEPGTYEVWIQESGECVETLYLFNQSAIEACLTSLPVRERATLRQLGEVHIHGPVLVADPSFVYDDYPISPLFPQFVMCMWGRDQPMARTWLEAHDIPHDECGDEGCLRMYGTDRAVLESRVSRMRRELQVGRKDALALMSWCKDQGMLWDYLMLTTQPRVLSYRRGETRYEGLICRPAYGDEDIYEVETMNLPGRPHPVGLRIGFMEVWDEMDDE